MLKSLMMMQLESRMVVCEDIGRQKPADLCKQIDAITAQDLLAVAQKFISKNPSVGVVGSDLKNTPKYEEIHQFAAYQREEMYKKYKLKA